MLGRHRERFDIRRFNTHDNDFGYVPLRVRFGLHDHARCPPVFPSIPGIAICSWDVALGPIPDFELNCYSEFLVIRDVDSKQSYYRWCNLKSATTTEPHTSG